jgi:hypothetical protein
MNQRAVYLFKYCTDGKELKGRKIDGNLITPHFFIILSKDEYNNNPSGYMTAIPISKRKNNLTDWLITEITLEDLDSSQTNQVDFDFLRTHKVSYALCDRPCRIHKDDLQNTKLVSVIKPSRYATIIETVMKGIKYYTPEPK